MDYDASGSSMIKENDSTINVEVNSSKEETSNGQTAEKVDLKVILENKVEAERKVVMADIQELAGDTSDAKKVMGVKVPILQINNNVIFPDQLVRLDLYLEDFLPSIFVRIKDTSRFISNNDLQGKNADMTLVLITPVDGIYKKIKLTFYVVDTTSNNGYIEYQGVYKFLPLENPIFESWEEMNTYSFLKKICEKTNLGFVSSPKCEDIEDKQLRIFQSKSYKNAIAEQMKFSGSKDAVFDCWIDSVGNITMVNMKHIFDTCMEIKDNTIDSLKQVKYAINPNDLKIKCIVSNISTETNLETEEVYEFPRILTNYEGVGLNNLKIIPNSECWFSNNTNIYSKGAVREYETIGQEGANNTNSNSLNNEVISINEPSVDGISNLSYEYKVKYYIGEEMGSSSILMREHQNAAFFEEKRSKYFYVELANPNYGLTRGMVIGIVLFSKDLLNKDVIKQQKNSKASTANFEDFGDGNISAEEAETIQSQNYLIATIKGLFYIDKMRITYSNKKIIQKLYLLQLNEQTCTLNKGTVIQR